MNHASLVKRYLGVIEEITGQLERTKSFEPDYLMAHFDALASSFATLAKLTNNGKGPTELRTEKLKALKTWLAAYKNKDQFLEDTIPKRYKNKAVAIDSETLDTYEGYANLAISYMTAMPAKYQEIKEEVLPYLNVKKEITKNLSFFQLDESDLMALAAKKPKPYDPNHFSDPLDDYPNQVSGMIHTPTKTINSVKTLLKAYGRFIKAVEAAQEEILSQLPFFENVDLRTVYAQFNKRNTLLQNLVKALTIVKDTIEKNDFHKKTDIIMNYQMMLNDMDSYLPKKIIKKLSLTTVVSPVQRELNNSWGKRREMDRSKIDPSGEFEKVKEELPYLVREQLQQSFQPEPIKLPEMPEKIIDEPVRKPIEIAPIVTKPDAVKEFPKELPKEEKALGEPISPEDKKRYQELWTSEASRTSKIIRFANYLAVKYQ